MPASWMIDWTQPTSEAYCRIASEPIDGENNYWKGVRWSPDGNCLLANSEDHVLRLFDLTGAGIRHAWGAPLPHETAGEGDDLDPSQSLKLAVQCREAEQIYDFAWYPGMQRTDPSSFCFASTSRDNPVHLWDGTNGALRCSYLGMNHLDELAPALSVAFSPDAAELYCGYENCVRIFDVSRPGRQCDHRPTTPTRRSRVGQKGLIACICVGGCGASEQLYAAGSYSGTVGLYDRRGGYGGLPLHVLDGATKASVPVHGEISTAPRRGVVQVAISPDGRLLLAALRNSSRIVGWDLRMLGHVNNLTSGDFSGRPLFTCLHSKCAASNPGVGPGVLTNQALEFGLSPSGQYCATGGADGSCFVYNLWCSELVEPNPAFDEWAPQQVAKLALHRMVSHESLTRKTISAKQDYLEPPRSASKNDKNDDDVDAQQGSQHCDMLMDDLLTESGGTTSTVVNNCVQFHPFLPMVASSTGCFVPTADPWIDEPTSRSDNYIALTRLPHCYYDSSTEEGKEST
eukprot:SAG31_NODE_2452_length_5666_cov_6.715825_1_plen_515_part_00